MATPLDAEARSRFSRDHPDWALDGETASRTLTFADFAEAMGFVNRVALVAEKADHHPDIDVRWNRVTLALSTHSAKAFTARDVRLIETIDGWES
ncbi:MAG TPA: 4a-hydroxytetrahydrobiopterin dehydratase [Acidimicrobiia bacterium]